MKDIHMIRLINKATGLQNKGASAGGMYKQIRVSYLCTQGCMDDA